MTKTNLIERLRGGIASTEHRWPGNDGSDWTYDFVGTRKAMTEAAALIEQQEEVIAELYESLAYIKTRERVLAGMSIADAEIHTTTEMNMIKAIYGERLAAKTHLEE